jgi:ABC-type transport system substrate-binding protein
LGIDPDKTSTWHSKGWEGFNWQAYSNPEVDQLIEEGLNYVEIEEARPIYQKLNRLIVEDMGYCWLNFQKGTFAAAPLITQYWGSRISLTIGLLAAFVSVTLGALIGALAGYYGGRLDGLLMRFTGVILNSPFIILPSPS